MNSLKSDVICSQSICKVKTHSIESFECFNCLRRNFQKLKLLLKMSSKLYLDMGVFKINLDILKNLKDINSKIEKTYEYMANNELIIDLTNSGESCAQNYCQINTQLIESFECFNKSIDNNKQFKCFWPKCQFKTERKDYLAEHRLIHSNKRQFVCDFNNCNKKLNSRKSLINHKLSHLDENHFKCDFKGCNKSFKRNNNLKEHKESIHLKIRYSCDWKDCNKTFISITGRYLH